MKRLTTPLVRDPGSPRGQLREATWEEALTRAAAGLSAVRDRHGGKGVGIFSCSKATNEVNYLAAKLARVAFHTNNIDSCNRT